MVGGHVGVAKGISNVYRRIESRSKDESTEWSTNFRFSSHFSNSSRDVATDVNRVHVGKESLSVTIIDEIYTFLMEVKLPRNHRSQCDSSLEK